MAEEQKGPDWTEAGLRKIKATGRREVFPDPDHPGLVLLMTPAGVKTFFIVYRAGGGRAGVRRWFKVGRLGVDLGLADARKRAVSLRGRIADGFDPQAERKASRAPKIVADTVADLAARFDRDYLEAGKVRASTARFYRQHLRANVLPALGTMKVLDVRPSHVAALLDSLSTGTAGKVRSTVSRLFSRAELWGLRDSLPNPVKGTDKPEAVARTVRLSADQFATLGKAIQDGVDVWQLRALVVLLAASGMRVGELAGNAAAKIPPRPWDDVDLDRGVIVIPAALHKTGRRAGDKTIYLCPQAVEYLRGLPRENELVLAGWANPQHGWERLRATLGLEGVNLHDLRHTFASLGDDLGYSQATVGALLGHSAATMTAKYQHKLSKDLAEAAAAIGGEVWTLLGFEARPLAESVDAGVSKTPLERGPGSSPGGATK